jgi:hypothetical protein
LKCDLKALTIYKNLYVVSGGEEGLLNFGKLKYDTKMAKTFTLAISSYHEISNFNEKHSLLLCNNNSNELDLIKIPKNSGKFDKTSKNVVFSSSPTKVLTIKLKGEGGWQFCNSKLSSNAKWIAAISLDSCFLYNINEKNKIVEVVDTINLNEYNITPGHFVEFVESKYLIIGSFKNQVQVFDIEKKTSFVLNTDSKRNFKLYNLEDSITSITTSQNYVVVTFNNSILEFEIIKNEISVNPKQTLNLQHGLIYKCKFLDKSKFYVLTTNNIINEISTNNEKNKIIKTEKKYPSSVSSIVSLKNFNVCSTIQYLFHYNSDTFSNLLVCDKDHSILNTHRVNNNEILIVKFNVIDYNINHLNGVCFRKRFGAGTFISK